MNAEAGNTVNTAVSQDEEGSDLTLSVESEPIADMAGIENRDAVAASTSQTADVDSESEISAEADSISVETESMASADDISQDDGTSVLLTAANVSLSASESENAETIAASDFQTADVSAEDEMSAEADNISAENENMASSSALSQEESTITADGVSASLDADEKSSESISNASDTEPVQDIFNDVISSYGYVAYVESLSDQTVITYPDFLTDSEVSAFLDWELFRYGYDGTVGYSIDGNNVTITYPVVEETTRRAAIRQLERDLNLYLSSSEEKAMPESPDTINITNIYTSNIVNPLIKEEAEEEWKDISHTLSLSVSPYAFSYVDFFRARDVIQNGGIPLSEFTSSYGFSANLSYEWRILRNLSIGLEAGFNGYYQNRSVLPASSLYYKIPVLANVMFHTAGEHLDFSIGLNAGADIASLIDTNGVYFMAGLEMGLSWRFAEHWSLFWKAMADFSMQFHPVNDMMDSFTYTVQPAFIGISYHI